MKNRTLIALVAALALGTAGAQVGTVAGADDTLAGTSITNTAYVTFTPAGGTEQPPVPSNTVTTTVDPVPSFSLVYDGSPLNDGGDNTAPNYAGTTIDKTVTCSTTGTTTVSFDYILKNTGNVPNETYVLTTGTPTGVSPLAPTNITYTYVGTSNQAAVSGTIAEGGTTVQLDPQEQIIITQTYTVSCASAGVTYSAAPIATRQDNPGFTNDPVLAPDRNNANNAIIGTYNAVAVGPDNYPAGDAPTGTYTSGGIPISQTGDTQTATPACIATPTTVTFTNTIRNGGNATATYTLSSTPTATITPSSITLTAGQEADFTVTYTYTPTVLADGTCAPVNIVVTATGPGGTTDTTTNTIAPQKVNLAPTKTVSPAGNQAPGTVLTYTVTFTNTLSSTLYGVKLCDYIPTNTTYVADSLNVTSPAANVLYSTDGGSTWTATEPDISGATDTATGRFCVGSNTSASTPETINGTDGLAPGASIAFTFQVTIK